MFKCLVVVCLVLLAEAKEPAFKQKKCENREGDLKECIIAGYEQKVLTCQVDDIVDGDMPKRCVKKEKNFKAWCLDQGYEASILNNCEAQPVSVKWSLGMNLNPSDGHIMDYTTGWAEEKSIGTFANALTMDFLNSAVWTSPANYIAIVRHQGGVVDAVKVFRFKEVGKSLLTRFQAMDPGREVVTEGGPIQESIGANAQNMADDPIFSVDGDLAFNWGYYNNGVRIVLTGGHLSDADSNDDNTHGLGNHLSCNPKTGTSTKDQWKHEIANSQDCGGACSRVQVQGTDHGTGYKYASGPVYGNYAIYVSDSDDAPRFPEPGHQLDIELEVSGLL